MLSRKPDTGLQMRHVLVVFLKQLKLQLLRSLVVLYRLIKVRYRLSGNQLMLHLILRKAFHLSSLISDLRL